MSKPLLTVYGAFWCPDCRRAKSFLGDHQIPYAWVNIEEDAAAEQLVIRLNEGKRIIPTIVFDDGTRLVEPSNAELAAKLGLRTSIDRKFWPLICIGAGPAALVASIYTTREGIDTLLLERGAPGGQATRTFRYENVPGFADGIEGNAFAERLQAPALPVAHHYLPTDRRRPGSSPRVGRWSGHGLRARPPARATGGPAIASGPRFG